LLEAPFFRVLIQSSTFWETVVLWSVVSISLLVFAIYLLLRMRGKCRNIKQFHSDSSGAAAAIDFAFTIPIFTFVIMAVIQFALFAQSALIVHYSAYTGARSARVMMWDLDPARVPGANLELAYKNILYRKKKENGPQGYREKVENAVHFALIAASPFKRSNCRPSKNIPTRVLQEIARSANLPSKAAVLKAQACYAYDARNSKIDIETGFELLRSNPEIYSDFIQRADAWPVKVTVNFRYKLSIPIVKRLWGKRDAQGYYRNLPADVVLL
jgi:hypothetical protein